MIRYEIKLKKIGEMTTLPDSQRLFGFLINNSKKYCSEDEISAFVKGVRDQKEKCMISSILPTGYYPTPKEFVMQNLQKRLVKNNEEIKLLEEKQKQIKKESDSLIRDTINKKKKEKSKKNLKSAIEDLKTDYNNISYAINNLSAKRIYETIKSMDFIDQNQLKNMLQLGEVDEKLEVEDFKDFEYINKNQNFIQKFRLENQIKQLPGMPNVAYSLPILSFKNKAGDIQKDFSFFVRVSKDSCISKALEGIKKFLKKIKPFHVF